jgi:hypothetical protein
MIEKEFLACYGSGITSFINLYNGYRNKYKSDENRPNNNIFSILNESVLRECIANKFIENSNNYKITVEAFYERKDDNKKRKKLDLLIWKDNKMLCALELKIERDDTTTSDAVRDMIIDANRLIESEKFKDAEKYVVLVIDYTNIDNKCNEEQKTKRGGKTIFDPDFYKLLKNLLIPESNTEEFNFRELAKKVESIKTNDIDWKNWLKIVENSSLFLKFKHRIKFGDSKEIILFKCEKNKTDNENKNEISNS